MERKEKEITVEELARLLQSQEGDFIIHVEPGEGEGDADGESGAVSA